MKKMISRRDFLKAAGISAAALSLAACGGSGTSTAASTASTAASTGSSAAASGSAITLKLGFSTNEEDPRAKGAKQFAEEVAEKTGGAAHVPQVLYYWRVHEGSTSGGTDAMPYVAKAAKKALADHLERTGRTHGGRARCRRHSRGRQVPLPAERPGRNPHARHRRADAVDL